MAEDCPKPDRPWRVIAQEVSTERDSDKVAELSEELIKALENDAEHPSQQTPQHDQKQARRKSA